MLDLSRSAAQCFCARRSVPCLMPNRRESQKVPRKTRRLTRTPLGHLPYTRWGEAGILGLGLGGWLVCAALLLLIVVVVGRWAAHGETWRKVPVVVRLLRELADHAELASVRLPEHVLVKHAAVHKKAPLIGHDIEHLVSPERGRFGHFVIVPLRDEESVNRHDVVRSIHWSRWQIGDRDAFNLQRDGRQSRDRAAPVLEDMGNEDPHSFRGLVSSPGQSPKTRHTWHEPGAHGRQKMPAWP